VDLFSYYPIKTNTYNPMLVYKNVTFIYNVNTIANMVILFDQYNLPKDIYEIIFATEQQKIVAKMLIKRMKENGGVMGKTEMSLFATKLHEGELIDDTEESSPFKKEKKPKMSYNKRQFYDRILTPMKTMGLIDYDMYQKTYKISNKFNTLMIKIGLMWLQEIRK
jgi:hypothetical protein